MEERDFVCNGYELFDDINGKKTKISCWRANPHGEQSLRQALMNSCNPAFMQLGARITAPTLYKYYDAFGLFESTNSGLYGEQSSIFQKLDEVGPVELATISFGQRFEITPIQLATAVSSIANGGTSVSPRVVKQIINSQTKEVTDIPVKTNGTVISKETSEKVLSMMESVVSEGTRKKCKSCRI